MSAASAEDALLGALGNPAIVRTAWQRQPGPPTRGTKLVSVTLRNPYLPHARMVVYFGVVARSGRYRIEQTVNCFLYGAPDRVVWSETDAWPRDKREFPTEASAKAAIEGLILTLNPAQYTWSGTTDYEDRWVCP